MEMLLCAVQAAARNKRRFLFAPVFLKMPSTRKLKIYTMDYQRINRYQTTAALQHLASAFMQHFSVIRFPQQNNRHSKSNLK